MVSRMKRSVLTLTAVGLLILGLGLFAGSTAGTGASLSAAGSVSGASAASSVATGTFNFSNPHPVWDTGNLCVVQVNGAYWTCNYSGNFHHPFFGPYASSLVSPDCGCYGPSSLIYNFSTEHVTLNISLSDLSRKVPIFINLEGNYTTININITGCRGGGLLNVSVLGEYDFIHFTNSASGVSSSFALYENHDGFYDQVSGSWDRTSTYFVGAAPKYSLCPWENGSRTDKWSVSLTGWKDFQKLEWANGIGYNTTPNRVSVGNWSHVLFENTTSFACYWSLPATTTCHHGWGPFLELAATRRN